MPLLLMCSPWKHTTLADSEFDRLEALGGSISEQAESDTRFVLTLCSTQDIDYSSIRQYTFGYTIAIQLDTLLLRDHDIRQLGDLGGLPRV